jgi:methylmalonyl-CoA carboxyltransferase large subunit
MRVSDAGKIGTLLAEIRVQLQDLAARVGRLEKQQAVEQELLPAKPSRPAMETAAHPVLSEEKLVLISAAVAACLGERVRIRQIRLVRSNAWAQQGRVSVQASHWLHH